MSVFYDRSMYASDLQLAYDNEKQKYLGEFSSVGGTYRIEGIDRADISYEMQRLLELEYNSMLVNAAKSESYSKGRGGGGSSTQPKPKNQKPTVSRSGPERGMKVYTIDVDDQKNSSRSLSFISKASTWVDLITTTIALSTGNFLEATMATASLSLGEWNEGLESIWKGPKENIFSVVFCGVVIKAKSKRSLRKKLLRQKNRRIQMIMMHLRKNGAVDGSSEMDPFIKKSERKRLSSIKKKKKKAAKNFCKLKRDLAHRSWKQRISPQGRSLSAMDRSGRLKNNLIKKKQLSEQESVGLWSARV